MRLAWLLLRRYPARFFALAVSTLLGTGTASSLLWTVEAAAARRALTVPLGALFVALLAGRVVLDVLVRTQFVALASRTLADLRVDLGERAMRAPLEELEGPGAGQLENTFGEEVTLVAQGATALAEMASAIAFLLGSIVFVVATAGWYGPPIVVVMLIGFLVLRKLTARADARFAVAMPLRGRMGMLAGLVFRGLRELKLHAPRRRAVLQAFEDATANFHRHMLSATTLYGALDSATVFLFLLLSAGVAFGLGPVLGERTPLVVMGLLFMQGPLDTIVFELQSVSLGATVLEQTRAMTFATEPDAASAPAREVGLRGATRAYVGEDGKDFELGPVDVTLRPGEVLFVVGGNGSGKSTLAKVLTGLYVAQEGAVLVDGAEVAPGEGAPVLRGSFAAVFAEGFVPRRMWGVPPEEAARVGTPLLEELELSDKVQIADGAFTEVGVSSGQRKRLALVAAMVRGRSLFVFDEWAAEQDPKWRAWFYERFLPRLRDAGRAVLVVTHDDAYFHLADRVLHLRDGRVLDGGAS